ncbi:MAG: phospholipase A [Tahibacter sp.]
MRRTPPYLMLVTVFFILSSVCRGSGAAPLDPHACSNISADVERLACYDRAMGRATTAKSPGSSDSNVFLNDTASNTEEKAATRVPISLLDSRWELDPDSKLGPFHIRAYKPVYLLPLFMSSDINGAPTSPSTGHSVEIPDRLQHAEMKFQLSLKSKVWQGVFGDHGDLWVGYTQTSHWQINNSRLSRPFRETNYEPEAMLTFATNYQVFGWDARMIGIGVNHQSNGRGLPLSRSWNRVVANIGFERGDWTIMLRPWWRIAEPHHKDDNPDISDFMGRGDAQIVRVWNGHEFSLLFRHTLRGGDDFRGAVGFDWAFPIKDELRGHVQLFDGYGESLIDYNHRATYLGLGVSLLEWY